MLCAIVTVVVITLLGVVRPAGGESHQAACCGLVIAALCSAAQADDSHVLQQGEGAQQLARDA